VSSVIKTEGRLLEDVPADIRDVLEWYGAGRPQRTASRRNYETYLPVCNRLFSRTSRAQFSSWRGFSMSGMHSSRLAASRGCLWMDC